MRNSGGVVYVGGVQSSPPVPLSLGSLLLREQCGNGGSGQLTDCPAPGSLQEALGGLGWGCSFGRWEACSGERDGEGRVLWSVLAFYLWEESWSSQEDLTDIFFQQYSQQRGKSAATFPRSSFLLLAFILYLNHGDTEQSSTGNGHAQKQ